jgi:hypothetical protein
MTRETQVGLLVSGTFVCLVGTVMYIKMNDLDVPAAPAAEASARSEMPPFHEAPPASPTPAPTSAQSTEPRGPVELSLPHQGHMDTATRPPSHEPAPEATTSTTPAPEGPRHAEGPAVAVAPTSPLADVSHGVTEPIPPPTAPVSPPPAFASDPPPPVAPVETPPAAPMGSTEPSPAHGHHPGQHGATPAAPEPPPPAATVAPEPPAPTAVMPLPTPEKPADPPAPTPTPAPTAVMEGVSGVPTTPTPTPEVVRPDGRVELPAPPPAAPPTSVEPPPTAATTPSAAMIPPAPVEAPVPAPAAAPTAPVTPPASLGPPEAHNIRPVPSPAGTMPEAHGPAAPAADTMPEPSHTAPAPTTETQVAQANTNLPPIGATPRIQSPPIPLPNTSVARALAPTQPQVVTFDEESYRSGPGDTFQSISEKFYHSKVYDQALILFNRDHPMSAGSGATPQPGQTIFIPPLSILEERYPQALPTLTPVKPAAAPVRVGAAGVPATVASYATTYQVPTAGMSFYQVAQHALGSGERWGEIYRLNPQYSPQGPLPAGSILRMPPPSGLAPTATR